MKHHRQHHRQHHQVLDFEATGRVQFGDVSAWAPTNTKPVLPKVNGRRLTYSPKVTDLGKIRPVAVSYPHSAPPPGFVAPQPERDVTPATPTRSPGQIAAEVNALFDKLNATRVQHR